MPCFPRAELRSGSAADLYRVPSYFDYLMDELDLVETYRIHKRQLQALQWRCERKPWALKYPNHVIAMKEILQVYPDARMVMTHRDPVQTLASICKMTFNLRGMRSAGPVDPKEVGRNMLHFIDRHIERIMSFDQSPEGGRVVHVDYYALIDDPVREMRAIHAGIGIDTPEGVARAVGDWHKANPEECPRPQRIYARAIWTRRCGSGRALRRLRAPLRHPARSSGTGSYR